MLTTLRAFHARYLTALFHLALPPPGWRIDAQPGVRCAREAGARCVTHLRIRHSALRESGGRHSCGETIAEASA